jgi:hypothetical protein
LLRLAEQEWRGMKGEDDAEKLAQYVYLPQKHSLRPFALY